MTDLAHRIVSRFRTAAVKHPAVVQAIVAYFKDGPFKRYFKLKAARGDKLTLVPQGLNDQVDRVEMTGLNGDKAEFMIHMKNGDSGWAWDEYQQPPKFHNHPGYNVLHLDRLEKYVGSPEFAQHMESFGKTLAKAVQRAGWVMDPVTKRMTPLDQWQEAIRARAKAEEEAEARAKAEAEAKAREQAAESEEAWSVVTLGRGHGYATEVDTYSSKAKAEEEARNRGDCYVVKGTQMWNEPLGQVEEHDRDAPYRYFR